ncbi:hypothetical protein B0H13DRAFT_1870291 [Mycena leptocephala]|nr:hypothetical protein B0H13DRAFT_1870291 [Mycena leptocephala]
MPLLKCQNPGAKKIKLTQYYRGIKTPPTGKCLGSSGAVDLQRDRYIEQLKSASNRWAREDRTPNMLNANLLLIILPLGLVGILQKRTTPKASRVSVQNANFSDPGIFRIRVLTLGSACSQDHTSIIQRGKAETFLYDSHSSFRRRPEGPLNMFPGAYAVMFGFYIHVLHTRGIPKTRFLPVATISLFILCTAHLALLLASTTIFDQTNETSAVGAGDPSYLVFQLNFATTVIYVTNNIIADSIFIFRCYAIWNFDPKIIFLPILLTFVVVAGRIWWLACKGRDVLGQKITTRYNTACVMMSVLPVTHVSSLESGVLYCVGGIVYIILSMVNQYFPLPTSRS